MRRRLAVLVVVVPVVTLTIIALGGEELPALIAGLGFGGMSASVAEIVRHRSDESA